MQPTPIAIPMPEILDPASVPSAPEAGEVVPREALEIVCHYGQQLWADLDRMRTYLLRSLPTDPRQPGPRRAASPRGPDDEEGWSAWIAAYSEVTSVLAGPRGDSGFGIGEAMREAELRRESPTARLMARRPASGAGDAESRPDSRPAQRKPLKPLAATLVLGALLREVVPRIRRARRARRTG